MQENTLPQITGVEAQRDTFFNDPTDEQTRIRSNSHANNHRRHQSFENHWIPDHIQFLINSLREQQTNVARMQESLFSQFLTLGYNNPHRNGTSQLLPAGLTIPLNNNTTHAQTFEGDYLDNNDDDYCDENMNIALQADKEQLEIARTLILQ